MFVKQKINKSIKKSKTASELLNDITNIALDNNANNIHLEPRGYYYHIRYRIDNELKNVGRMPFEFGTKLINYINKIKSKNDNFTLDLKNKSININSYSFPTIFGEKVTLNFIKKDGIGLTSLKLNKDQINTITNSLLNDKGLILLTGFKASEKNKVLYALMHNLLENNNSNLFSIEDYIDYSLPNVKQKALEKFDDTSVFRNLQTINKKNPNAIMLSHITGPTTAKMVINSALLNNLIITYLPNKEEYNKIPSLDHWGIDEYLIKSALKLIIHPDEDGINIIEY